MTDPFAAPSTASSQTFSLSTDASDQTMGIPESRVAPAAETKVCPVQRVHTPRSSSLSGVAPAARTEREVTRRSTTTTRTDELFEQFSTGTVHTQMQVRVSRKAPALPPVHQTIYKKPAVQPMRWSIASAPPSPTSSARSRPSSSSQSPTSRTRPIEDIRPSNAPGASALEHGRGGSRHEVGHDGIPTAEAKIYHDARGQQGSDDRG